MPIGGPEVGFKIRRGRGGGVVIWRGNMPPGWIRVNRSSHILGGGDLPVSNGPVLQPLEKGAHIEPKELCFLYGFLHLCKE